MGNQIPMLPGGLQIGHIVLHNSFHILKLEAGGVKYREVTLLIGGFGNVAV